MEKIKMGFIPAHRDIFSREWAIEMKARTMKALSKISSIEVVTPTEQLTPDGLVSDEKDAKKTIELFLKSKIDAILIGTMNFGEELPVMSIIEVFKDKPIMLFGTKEGDFTKNGCRRSDSFCGTLSISSGLHRRNKDFLFLGIVFPEEKIFSDKIITFAQTINVIKNIKCAKIGIIGPRPNPFETCTINEAYLVSKFGIRIHNISLLSLSQEMKEVKDDDSEIKKILEDVEARADCNQVNHNNLVKLAKMEKIIKNYIKQEDLTALALSCWPDIPNLLGVSPCLVTSRLTELGVPTACEADIYGAISMLIQYLASFGKDVPHFVDWTIQNQKEENKFLSWHCGNAPMCHADGNIKLANNSVGEKAYGKENTECTVEFQLKEGKVSLNSFVEYNGNYKMLITNGEICNEAINLRGSWCWIKVANLNKLYDKLITEGFTHHTSMVYNNYSEAISNFCDLVKIEKVVV